MRPFSPSYQAGILTQKKKHITSHHTLLFLTNNYIAKLQERENFMLILWPASVGLILGLKYSTNINIRIVMVVYRNQ